MAVSRSQGAPCTGAFLFFCVLALASLTAWTESGAAGRANTQAVRVADVVDGDTVILSDRRHVRLIGINAPETGKRKRGSVDQPLARAAQTYLRELVSGKGVRLELGPERHDRYGRTLAHLWLPDGRNVQELLLARGLAAVVAIPPNIGQLKRYQGAERRARANHLGIWGHPYYTPIAAAQLQAKDRGFRFVHGRIRKIWRSRKYIYLELSPSLNVMVPRADWAYFRESPEDLVGRDITVRGWVTRYKDALRIRAGHPAMLGLVY